eukprot:SAG11_NODE_7954_length_1078_cov_0.822268_1_plen_98_part_10
MRCRRVSGDEFVAWVLRDEELDETGCFADAAREQHFVGLLKQLAPGATSGSRKAASNSMLSKLGAHGERGLFGGALPTGEVLQGRSAGAVEAAQKMLA